MNIRNIPSRLLAVLFAFSCTYANPILTPGVWKEITPAGFNPPFGALAVAVDPSNPSTLYLTPQMWKSTDAGSTWRQVGNLPRANLDCFYVVMVDPNQSGHLYATAGVSASGGFWISNDGGETWTQPQGFTDIAASTATADVTDMAVDPTDFRHILVGSHSPWRNMGNAGILESKDGGQTWTAHQPVSSWGAGSQTVGFLYNPAHNQGNSETWLVETDGNGAWRTTNAGATWTQVNTWGCGHGGGDVFYSKTGAVYTGGYQYPQRSTDNGVTWTQLSNGPNYGYYYSICGDGNFLYTTVSFPTTGCLGAVTYYTSPETDGVRWTSFQNGSQTFCNGPYRLTFDKTNRIMYSANFKGGVWALKVDNPTPVDLQTGSAQSMHRAARATLLNVIGNHLTIPREMAGNTRMVDLYSVSGAYIGSVAAPGNGMAVIDKNIAGAQILVAKAR